MADVNPEFPETDRIVRAKPIDSDTVYGYPESRLESQNTDDVGYVVNEETGEIEGV